MWIIGAIASIAVFLALCVYIFLLNLPAGRSITLYSTIRYSLLSLPQKIFLGVAALGIWICLYKGTEAMFWWVPASWGSWRSGEYHSFRDVATFFLSFAEWAFLMQSLQSATLDKASLQVVQEKAREYKRILKAHDSASALSILKEEYEKKLEILQQEVRRVTKPLTADRQAILLLHPCRRVETYLELIDYIERIGCNTTKPASNKPPISPKGT